MIHNFESEIEKIECDPAIKACLKELYAVEEGGLSEPSEIPKLADYENLIGKYCNQSNISDIGGR